MPAPKGNKNALGNPGGGRPSLYKPEYAEMAEKMAILGIIDAELANVLGVSETTIHAWKHEHVEFSEALKKGKVQADAQVASRLYERAMGFSHPEEKIFQADGQIIRADTVKQYPPDTAAAIFWLKNRRPDVWRDKMDHNVSGSVTLQVVDYSSVDEDG